MTEAIRNVGCSEFTEALATRVGEGRLQGGVGGWGEGPACRVLALSPSPNHQGRSTGCRGWRKTVGSEKRVAERP